MDWKLSKEELSQLTHLKQSVGWKVLCKKQRLLQKEAEEYLVSAETLNEFLRRKGFLEGVSQGSEFLNHLLEMGRGEDRRTAYVRKWIERQVEKSLPDPELMHLLTQ